MASKKGFQVDNPAMAFISQPEQKTPAKAKTAKEKAPEGYKLNPAYIETKSKRVQLLVQPSAYNDLKKKATAKGISINEAINEAIKDYLGR